jgi:tetratricopeptide (TPR) repeat protein
MKAPSFLALCVFPLILSAASCAGSAARAEEYYAMGNAYFELKKYGEAERWFNRSKFHESTRIASEYNLGRIAYETGRYKEAAVFFDRIIERDPENITALKAAAYTCIKTEDFEKAEEYYRRILALVPESHDDGFNYALVLMALGREEETERILVKYNNTENPEALLLLARAQSRLGKPEAADAYSASLLKEDNPEVRIEYAGYLESRGLPVRALEEYNRALQGEVTDTQREEIKKQIERLEGNAESG